MAHKFTCRFFMILVLTVSSNTLAFAEQNEMLLDSINGEQRSEQNRTRDKARHPQKTLEFFDVRAKDIVMEVWPGKGWYTEILAPYLKQGGGRFVAAGFPIHEGPQWRRKIQQAYQDYLGSMPKYYDEVSMVGIGPPSFWALGKDNSVDTLLTFRSVHNWLKGGYEEKMFTAFFQVLKAGGVLGVVEHRAQADTDIKTMKQSGYVTEQLVIKLAEQAGFILEGRSGINSNSKDTKSHPKGVWTLPPTLRLGSEEKEKYLGIGESDRMTLKFRKP